MRDAIITRMKTRFESYRDIANMVDDNGVQARIDVPKHKSLSEHIWCVVGARESYAKALVDGEWAGFACSMDSCTSSDCRQKLESSAREVISAIEGVSEWTDARNDLLLALNEHEVMHEGQIIRHLYGLELEIPPSVSWA